MTTVGVSRDNRPEKQALERRLDRVEGALASVLDRPDELRKR